jgi:hypothetical protein
MMASKSQDVNFFGASSVRDRSYVAQYDMPVDHEVTRVPRGKGMFFMPQNNPLVLPGG